MTFLTTFLVENCMDSLQVVVRLEGTVYTSTNLCCLETKMHLYTHTEDCLPRKENFCYFDDCLVDVCVLKGARRTVLQSLLRSLY